MSDLNIIYHEGPCIIVNKPYGLLTQAPPNIASLENQIKDYLRAKEGKTGKIYLGILHRLDRPVSGAIVFARHVRAAQRIAEQFRNKTVTKKYWACVSGNLDQPQGTLRNFMRKIPDIAQSEILPEDHPEAKEAILHYKEIGKTTHGSFLEITLETGRTHQIRLQLSHHGFPILGDSLYHSDVKFGPDEENIRDRAIALHSRTLGLIHPMTKEKIQIDAEVPECWSVLNLPG